MSYFPNDIADVLSAVQGVDFFFDGIYIASPHFRQVAAAIRGDCIWVLGSHDLEAGTVAGYSAPRNTMYYDADAKIDLADPFTASSFVHEATHAINDMFGRASISRIDNEASAYIAQWQYLSFFAPIPEYYMTKGPFQRLANALSILKALMALADLLNGAGTKNLTGAGALKELRDALSSEPDLYKDVAGQISDDSRGIPFIGTIKKIDTKANSMTVLAYGKDVTSTVSTRTWFGDAAGNDIVLGLKDKRFATGIEIKITRETAGFPDEASQIQLRK